MRTLFPAILLLGACTEPTRLYHNIQPNVGQAEFQRDNDQCTQESTKQTVSMVGGTAWAYYVDSSKVQACLQARGWQVTRK
jgi:hypothetical protein